MYFRTNTYYPLIHHLLNAINIFEMEILSLSYFCKYFAFKIKDIDVILILQNTAIDLWVLKMIVVLVKYTTYTLKCNALMQQE